MNDNNNIFDRYRSYLILGAIIAAVGFVIYIIKTLIMG